MQDKLEKVLEEIAEWQAALLLVDLAELQSESWRAKRIKTNGPLVVEGQRADKAKGVYCVEGRGSRPV